MSTFKKNLRKIGKGTDETVALHKQFEVLNCTPVDYFYTQKYAEFLIKSKKVYRKVIQKIVIDDLCPNIFDYIINANVDEMKKSANEQLTYHMQIINHHNGILQGNIAGAKRDIENLKQDLADVEAEVQRYKELKIKMQIN